MSDESPTPAVDSHSGLKPLRQCSLGLSLRMAHEAAFQKVVVAEVRNQPAEIRGRCKRLAQMAFAALQKHEESCPVCCARSGSAQSVQGQNNPNPSCRPQGK